MEAIDFMDPKRRRRHEAMLVVGYVLIGVIIVAITVILMYVAYGYWYKNGQVIRNGQLFLSSTPNPATIYVNGERYKDTTNTLATLPEGAYNFELKRSGYDAWQRTIIVEGGRVLSYTYPFFFPTKLTTTTTQDYLSVPALVAQSPDRRWLLVARPGSFSSFDLYDLNNPRQVPTVISLPAGLLSPAATSQSLQLGEWSNDNRHVVFEHLYDGNTEYILLDRSAPEQSVNLTKVLTLPLTTTDLRLSNKKYDQYVIYDTARQTLSRATLTAPQLQLSFEKVLAFATYSDHTVLYATPDAADAAKVDIDLYDGSNTYLIRRDAANTTYLLNLTTYSGDLYVAMSATSENTAYLYKSPVNQITGRPGMAMPIRVFHIASPTYVSFSANAQYVAFEGGSTFVAYDIENQQDFVYLSPDKLDEPQTHATWMDGARLTYVSGGKLVVMDYDGNNRRVLVPADPAYLPYFDRNYKFIYALAHSSAANKTHELLTSTTLRTPGDQ